MKIGARPTATTRRTLTRGRSRSSTREMMPNSPYPPIASLNNSGFSVRAPANGAVRPDELERFDLADNRFQIQAAPVRVARRGAGNAQSIRACEKGSETGSPRV